MRKDVDIGRIKIANDRIANCLQRLGVKNEGYPIRWIELAFINLPYRGKIINARSRRRLLTMMLTGKAHPKMNAWIDHFEKFVELTTKLKRDYMKRYVK